MSFQKFSIDTIKNYRKESDSHWAKHFFINFHILTERASAFTSKGSITLEAAVVVPIFFFAMLCLAFLLEMMSVQTSMRNAVYSAGRELAISSRKVNVITEGEMEQKIRTYMNGEREIDCSASNYNVHTGILNLCAEYEVEIPISLFPIPPIVYQESIRIKLWNGYVPGWDESTDSQLVYMTETGLVYHSSPDCTYLDMSVLTVSKTEIEELRNASGARYYGCESCGDKDENSNFFYITTYGTRYHTSLECKKIKRNVYTIPMDEVYGMGGCSKCVK